MMIMLYLEEFSSFHEEDFECASYLYKVNTTYASLLAVQLDAGLLAGLGLAG